MTMSVEGDRRLSSRVIQSNLLFVVEIELYLYCYYYYHHHQDPVKNLLIHQNHPINLPCEYIDSIH